jgi:ABC-type transport system involved in cytochrome c biogenesis ATPase subunit
MTHRLECSRTSTGDLMINEIDIRNYKCFEHLEIKNCRRVNIVVGDNGSGKTALLEAMFMALGASSEMVIRFRQSRGLDGSFRGSPRQIEETVWRDYFHKFDMSLTISIILIGSGPEARSVRIDRGQGDVFVPLDNKLPTVHSAINFQWKDYLGQTTTVSPEFSSSGIKLPDTGEHLPDFFFLASNQTYSSAENADRFSSLSLAKRKKFVEVFTKEYSWIEDLTIESRVGSPAIFATVTGLDEQIPVTSISGGINRIITMLLMIASRDQSVVLIDEVENGIYYSHHAAFCRAMLAFANEYDSQLFVTTHSEEWLESLSSSYIAKKDDVSLWRLGRSKEGPTVKQFTGESLKTSIDIGGEVR